MKKYYYNCPRGFSNEFSIISVDQNSPAELAAFQKFEERYRDSGDPDWDLLRISYKRATEIIAQEKRTRKSYLAAGLNLSNNPVGATEIITAKEFFEEW